MSNNNITDGTTEFRVIDKRLFSILDLLYPVGRIIISNDSTAPFSDIGFGKWEALPPGYGLVAQGTATAEDGSTLNFTAGSKYGEFKHQLTVGEMPSHTHTLYGSDGNGLTTHPTYSDAPDSRKWTKNYRNWTNSMTSTGGDQYHNNISPCVAVYMWKRVA